MKILYGTKTGWTGDLIYSLLWISGNKYWSEEQRWGQTIRNFKSALVMAAEGILTRDGKRNYRFTIETYFHTLIKDQVAATEQFWGWGQFLLKGMIPTHSKEPFFIELKMEGGSLALDISYTGSIVSWKQDILVNWLNIWNWEILRTPVVEGERTFCLGEFLATELFANCGDLAGQAATIDEVIDRGQRWKLP